MAELVSTLFYIQWILGLLGFSAIAVTQKEFGSEMSPQGFMHLRPESPTAGAVCGDWNAITEWGLPERRKIRPSDL